MIKAEGGTRVKRWTPRDPVEALILCDTLLAELTPRYARALDHLQQMQPGHSGRPAGSGDPGGGSGFTSTSVVERTVARVSQTERRRLARLESFPPALVVTAKSIVTAMGARLVQLGPRPTPGQQLTWVAWATRVCVDLHHSAGTKIPRRPSLELHAAVCDLHDLVIAETSPATVHEKRSAELATDQTEMWCRSCLRVGRRATRSDRYPEEGLCRWCGDFKGAEGFLPTLNLIDAHHDARRITQAMVEAERPKTEKKKRRRYVGARGQNL